MMARRTTPAAPDSFARVLDRIGLARLLRVGTVGSIPAIWLEIALLHFRGSFQSRSMWIPVLTLPVVFAVGATAAALPDENRSRRLFRPLAWLMTAVGAIGTLFHLRGVARQMGGYSNWKYNVVTGPPFPAPAQVALFGLLGTMASAPSRHKERESLVAWARAVDALSYALLLVEAGYSHWVGGYFNRVMYTPILLSPLLAIVHAAAMGRVRLARTVEGPLSALATLGGLVGFAFHVRNISRRHGGFSWQNLFYGPPVVAPLQLTAQGVLGLLASVFDRRR
jgi:hypothetical protein